MTKLCLIALAATLPTWTPVAASGTGPELRAVSSVDLERYSGRWFEIARLPNRFQDDCAREVTADYTRRDDGRIEVINRCVVGDGKRKEARGVARIVDTKTRSKLKVRFAPAFLSFIPAVWGDYWIIDLAPDYSYAVIGEPSRRYLWILARTASVEEQSLQRILERVESQGYDKRDLLFTKQTD